MTASGEYPEMQMAGPWQGLHTLHLELKAEIRDAVFVDEDTLLLVDSKARLSTFSVHSHAIRAVPSHVSLKTRLAGIDMQPAHGGYPRIAAAPGAGTVVINVSDLVLNARVGSGGWQPMTAIYGIYYPHVEFSRDGTLFAAWGDWLFLFNARSLECLGVNEEACEFTWHPRKPLLLAILINGELGWMADARFQSIGMTALNGMDVVSLCFVGEQIVAIATSRRIGFWSLQPFEYRGCVEVAGEIDRLTGFADRSEFALQTDDALQFWTMEHDMRSAIPGASIPLQTPHACLSPSGRRVATLGNTAADSSWLFPRKHQELRIWQSGGRIAGA